VGRSKIGKFFRHNSKNALDLPVMFNSQLICLAVPFSTLPLIIALVLVSQAIAEEKPAAAPSNFAEHAKPVFRNHCIACHNQNRTEGDLNLANYSALMQGSSSGDVIEPGSAEDSFLFQLITHGESPEMPPSGQKIPAEDIETIRKWINDGAINRSGSKRAKKKKRKSLEMIASPGVRPKTIAMPVNLPVESNAQTTRAPIAASLASSPWAPVIAVAAANQVVLYHADPESEQRLLGVLPWEDGQPGVVRFSRDGSRLIAAGGRAAAAGNFVIWDVATGKRELKLGDELDSVLAVDLSSDGKHVATGGPERVVRLYALDDESEDLPTAELREHADWVTAVEFSPDGKYLVSGDRGGGLVLRIAATGESLFRLSSHKAAVTSVSWRPDSKVFASASESGKISFWDVSNAESGKPLKTFDAHKGGCLSIDFTRKGQLLSGGRDKKVLLWNLKGKTIRRFTGSSEIITSVCVNDEAGYVFAGNFAGQLKSWGLKGGKPLKDLETNPRSDQNASASQNP